MAGYYAVLGLAQLGTPAELWQQAFALIGAVAVGGTAWVRAVASQGDGERVALIFIDRGRCPGA